eukprot:2493729-Amphidinium_carterae.1
MSPELVIRLIVQLVNDLHELRLHSRTLSKEPFWNHSNKLSEAEYMIASAKTFQTYSPKQNCYTHVSPDSFTQGLHFQ